MDDLTGKINELLSDPESMEKIKSLAGMLSGPAQGENEGRGNGGQSGKPQSGEPQIDPATLLKIKGALDIMKKDDPRIDLLLALKPNLSAGRRKKVDEAIHILRLLSLMPLLKEQGIF